MLSKRQAKYVENRAKGMTKRQSAIMADLQPAKSIEQLPTVKESLSRIRAEMALEAGVTRQDVVNMLMDAAEMAKLMSDPSAMVMAAREIGKILGHYAPEVKKIVRSMDQSEVKKALENMSDEELTELANARIRVIDGESTRLKDSSESETAVPGVQGRETPEVLLQEEPNMP